jgi:steroid 5-alpha reductase family enzyme
MGLLVTIWGLRLSFNFWLKGGYQWKFWEGEEDYRWRVLRNRKEFEPKWKWTAFNLLFISGYQHALILMLTLPAIVALQFDDRPFGPLDLITSISILFFIVFESVADWQQWRFQERKRQTPKLAVSSGIPDDACPGKGFLDQGLWAYSRHPNYFAEQAIWVCFYLFSVSASGQWINWSITGCLLLMILFAGSSKFSEAISVSKYPEYRDYQKRVPRFLPTGTKKAGS